MTEARTTQAGFEAVLLVDPGARFTQAGVEVVTKAIPNVRTTQAGIEIVIPKGGGVQTVPLRFYPRIRRSVNAALFGDFLKTSSRTVPLTAFTRIGRRFVPLTFRPVTHGNRSVPAFGRIQRFAQFRTVALTVKLGLLGRIRTVPLLMFTSGVGPPWTRSQVVPLRAQLVKLNVPRTVPLTAAPMGRRFSRTVSLTARIGARHARLVGLSFFPVTHQPRLVPLRASLQGRHFVPLTARLRKVGNTRTVALTGRLKRVGTRTVPLTGRTKKVNVPRTVPLTANVTRNVLYITPVDVTLLFVGAGTQPATVAFVANTGNLYPTVNLSETASTTAAVSASDSATQGAGVNKAFSVADSATESEAARKRVDEQLTESEQASIKVGGVTDPATLDDTNASHSP